MNIGKFRELIGTVVIFRPRPKVEGGYLQESLNSWIILSEVEKNNFLLKNTITNHEFRLTPDNIREFRNPAFIILAGQPTLKEGGVVQFEPFAPGLKEPESLAQLIDEATRPAGNRIYEALKPYVGETVTLRFPDEGGTKFGTVEAILENCTPNYIRVRRQAIKISLPDWAVPLVQPQTPDLSNPAVPQTFAIPIPEHAASVPLPFVSVAEDLEEKRPMIIFEHSFWDP